MYKCRVCRAEFEEPAMESELHNEVDTNRWENYNLCPSCGDPDIREMDRCPCCGYLKAPWEDYCGGCSRMIAEEVEGILSHIIKSYRCGGRKALDMLAWEIERRNQ